MSSDAHAYHGFQAKARTPALGHKKMHSLKSAGIECAEQD